MNTQERHKEEIAKIRRFYLIIIIVSNCIVLLIPKSKEDRPKEKIVQINGHQPIKVSGRSFLEKTSSKLNRPITILNQENKVIVRHAFLANVEDTYSQKNQILTILVSNKDLPYLSKYATDQLLVYPLISEKQKKVKEAYEIIF